MLRDTLLLEVIMVAALVILVAVFGPHLWLAGVGVFCALIATRRYVVDHRKKTTPIKEMR